MLFKQFQPNSLQYGGLAGLQGTVNPAYNQMLPQMTIDAPMPQGMAQQMPQQAPQQMMQEQVMPEQMMDENMAEENLAEAVGEGILGSYLAANPHMQNRVAPPQNNGGLMNITKPQESKGEFAGLPNILSSIFGGG